MTRLVEPNPPRVFISGIAGFIGFHMARRCLLAGCEVAGADRMSAHNSPALKRARLDALHACGRVSVARENLADEGVAERLLAEFRPSVVFHMAARPGVRHPDARSFRDDNIVALINMLRAACRCGRKCHFVFASSSSVYGDLSPKPFNEKNPPAAWSNPYAASKIAGESIAQFWAMGRDLRVTCARLFNVYGPWGRPDSAIFRFADRLSAGLPAVIFNADAERSWLFIDDAIRACEDLTRVQGAPGRAQFVNVAGPSLVSAMDALKIVARQMGIRPHFVLGDADVEEAKSNPADVSVLRELTGRVPQTSLEKGVEKFLAWHRREWLNKSP